jgi:hypothetical protein
MTRFSSGLTGFQLNKHKKAEADDRVIAGINFGG